MIRASGIIMPVFSLPGKYGIGTFGREAYEFVDFLRSAGQKYWQVLPMGPTDCGNSPYSSLSVFAGNPLFIDLEELAGEGLLDADRLRMAGWGNGDVDYDKVIFLKDLFLRQAFERGYEEARADVNDFSARNGWVWDFGLYMALKNYFGGRPWYEWDEDIRLRESSAVMRYASELKTEINYHIYVQYLFFKQWDKLKKYAEKNGITFIGDIPIYAAMDSADVWATPENFQLDKDGRPSAVAGVPPDYFSKDGQLWGNPLYDWNAMEKDGYGWWIRRIDSAGKLYDVIRIDHFRGLESYWSVPYGEKTAINGHWEEGPGLDFINRIKGWFPGIKIIAEDLGLLTDGVRELLKNSGFPGMKVLQFAFDKSENSDYLPHKYERNCVCYGGTHDNATIREWLEDGDPDEIALAREYFGIGNDEDFCMAVIRGGMASVADTFITQMQDYLGLGAEARTNVPGTVGDNWKWRMKAGAADGAIAKKILRMTKLYGRYDYSFDTGEKTTMEDVDD